MCVCFAFAGLVGAFAISTFVALLTSYSLRTLSTCAFHYEAATYPILVEKALGGGRIGRVVSDFLSINVFLYLFGSLIAYNIVVGDVFPPIVAQFVGEDSFWCQRWVVISIPGLLVSLPLCAARTLGALMGACPFSILMDESHNSAVSVCVSPLHGYHAKLEAI